MLWGGVVPNEVRLDSRQCREASPSGFAFNFTFFQRLTLPKDSILPSSGRKKALTITLGKPLAGAVAATGSSASTLSPLCSGVCYYHCC